MLKREWQYCRRRCLLGSNASRRAAAGSEAEGKVGGVNGTRVQALRLGKMVWRFRGWMDITSPSFGESCAIDSTCEGVERQLPPTHVGAPVVKIECPRQCKTAENHCQSHTKLINIKVLFLHKNNIKSVSSTQSIYSRYSTSYSLRFTHCTRAEGPKPVLRHDL